MKDGKVIRGTILEKIPNETIIIKTNDFNVLTISFDEIESIYKDVPEIPIKKDNYFEKNKHNYKSVAIGLGNSYGDLGARYQQRFGRKLGIGYHAGVGFHPRMQGMSSSVWLSGGAKIFWYKGWYLDIIVGTIGRYKKWDYWSTEEKDIYGLSLLLGGDWFFNEHIGINVAAGFSYNYFKPEFKNVIFAADLGFVYKFNREEK